ncbi:hypothetical protein QG37_00521 [Candidozyma auris]|nr:hypothetical protein QG37_00521 [[Candida] auris]
MGKMLAYCEMPSATNNVKKELLGGRILLVTKEPTNYVEGNFYLRRFA